MVAQVAQASEAGRRSSIGAPNGFSVRRFPGSANQNRTLNQAKLIQVSEQLYIMFEGFAESDPGIQRHLVGGNAVTRVEPVVP